jgi:hypothetical protein
LNWRRLSARVGQGDQLRSLEWRKPKAMPEAIFEVSLWYVAFDNPVIMSHQALGILFAPPL